jgi:hypothetical protein
VMTNNAPRPQTTIADAPDVEDSEVRLICRLTTNK